MNYIYNIKKINIQMIAQMILFKVFIYNNIIILRILKNVNILIIK